MSTKSLLLLFLGFVFLTIQSSARPESTNQEIKSDLLEPLCVGDQWLEPLGVKKHKKQNPNCIPHERKKPPETPSPSQATEQEKVEPPSSWPVAKPPISSQAPSVAAEQPDSPQGAPSQVLGKPAFNHQENPRMMHHHPDQDHRHIHHSLPFTDNDQF